jgi:NAD(P)-dependent dehydrogenase (short-subunit alcohol dehydrogenase family)
VTENQQLFGMVGALLQGRVAIVTGAAAEQGIGRAIAVLFAEHGAKLAVVDIDRDRAAAVAASLGSGHAGYGCDITQADDCERVALTVERDLGPVRVLVNNAGVAGRQALLDIEPAAFERMLRVNVLGTFLMTKAVLPAMLTAGPGSIVFISSTAGQRGGGVFGSSHYVSAKAGMSGFARAVAREFAPHGIRANVIAPNLIKTDSTNEMSPEQRATVEKSVPLQRSGTIWDVAGAALFAASDLSSYVTGATIDVNGGFHIH